MCGPLHSYCNRLPTSRFSLLVQLGTSLAGRSFDAVMLAGVQGWTFDGESGECVNIPQVRCKAAPCVYSTMSPEGQLCQAFPVCELEACESRDCACAVKTEQNQGAVP